MSHSHDLDDILAAVARGEIDTAEAARRIAEINATADQDSHDAPETNHDPYDEPGPARDTVSHGRPQYATYSRESFKPATDDAPMADAQQAGSSEEADLPHDSDKTRHGDREPAAHSARRAQTDSDQPSDQHESDQPSDQQAADSVDAGAADSQESSSDSAEQTKPQTSPWVPPTTGPAGSRGVKQLRVRATGRRVKIMGDETVPTVQVQGPHTLRRSGESIEVLSTGDVGPTLKGFSLVNPPRRLDDLKKLGFGEELVFRVNPQIEVNAELTSGGLSTHQVPFLGSIRVTAGAAKIIDVAAMNDVLIQAGGASIYGAINQGRNRVRVESGNLTVGLSSLANVAVTADAQLGMVSWPGEQDGKVDEYLVGNGAARLELTAVLGHVAVRLEDHPHDDTNESSSDKQWWEVWKR